MRIEFNDFTIAKYKDLISYAIANYDITNYRNYHRMKLPLIWRHDIDWSVHHAYNISLTETEMGIKAIYYFLLKIDYYNILDKGTMDLIRKIKNQGHEIGLHFNHSQYGVIPNDEELIKYIAYERDIFQNELGDRIDSFAYHDTTPHILGFNATEYAGLYNVYSKEIRTELDYCSDSYGVWRFTPLEDKLRELRPLQALTHPETWSEMPASPRDRLISVFEGKTQSFIKRYDDFIQKNLPEIWKK